ncbi:hypothetical protein RSO01_90990 [Reyranella soli]|uniref:ATP-dependent DNA ligase family profile domain-containing protein n=1 Tax=Reyranella soli TaxID=1230389 RepID=A0A512NSK8_9HYPH|nr:hypothetical protein RSO01_90990 [Reyranella soli]
MDEGETDQLVFYAFDLLFLDGASTASLPLVERKAKLKRLFRRKVAGLLYSEHVTGDGPKFRAQACKLGLEGAISKPIGRMPRPTAGSGSSRSASTARNSWSSAGLTPRVAGRTSARCCWATTPRTGG